MHVPRDIALTVGNFMCYSAKYAPNWRYFGTDLIIKDGIDITVSEDANKIDQLYVRPVSFPQMLPNFLVTRRRRPQYNNELDER